MKQQELIKQIEKEIKELKSILTLWNREIEKYTLTLNELTNQLTNIKKQINKKNKK